MSQLRADIYLDTNIFIILGQSVGELPALLTDLIAAAADTGRKLGTSELTLAELVAKPYVEQRDELIDRYDGWICPSVWLEVGRVDREVLRNAGVARSHYRSVKLPDAIHLSTAIGLGCRYLLTTDTGLRDSYNISHTRYGQTRMGPSIAVVRPDRQTLINLRSELVRATT